MAKSGLKSASRRAGVGLAVLLLAGQGVSSEAKEYRQMAPPPAPYSKGEGEYLCPSGYEKSGDRCITAITRQPTMSCPPGTVEDGDVCVGTQRVNPSFVCPEGFVASSPISSPKKKHRAPAVPTCVSHESLPAIMRCPKGYDLSPEGDCVATHQERPVLVCEHGVQEADRCVAHSLFPADMTCPEGFAPEARSSHKKSYKYKDMFEPQCTRMASQPPIPECPEEYLLSEDFSDCTRSILKDPNFVCPELFELRGDVCAKDTFFPQTSICPEGYSLAESLVSTSSKKHKKHSRFEEVSAVCMRSVAVEADKYCKDRWTFNPTDASCTITHVEPALVKCPVGTEGSRDETGQLLCRDVDIQQPEKICESGVADSSGRCVLTDVFDASLACGPNAELRGETCVELEKIAPTNTCPEGWIVSSPYGHHKHFEEQAPACLKFDSVAPMAVCPHGVLATADECEDVKVTDPVPTCQAPMVLTADGVCFSERRMPRVGVCPDGYTQRGDSCIRSNTASYELQCPVGYELRAEANSSADVGHHGFEKFKKASSMKQQEPACVRVDVYPAAFACPEEYNLTNGSCVKSISIPAKPPKMGPMPVRSSPVSKSKKGKKAFHMDGHHLKENHSKKSFDLKEKKSEKMAALKEKHAEKTADLREHLHDVNEGVHEHIEATLEHGKKANDIHAKLEKIHSSIDEAKEHIKKH